jgi:hypothetical protein
MSLQAIIVALILCWAAWTALGSLAPKRQRKIRGALARNLEGKAPVRFVEWLRPGFPKTGCGCHDDGCTETPKKK